MLTINFICVTIIARGNFTSFTILNQYHYIKPRQEKKGVKIMSKKNEVMNPVENVAVEPARVEEYKKVCRNLASCVKSLELNYVKLAVGLAKIDADKLYEVDGYKNIYEFAKERYSISKSTCYDFLGLVSVFGLTSDSKPLYTSKQMVVMLPYVRKGGNIDEFSPNMSVREIKKFIKDKLSTRVENNLEVVHEQSGDSSDCGSGFVGDVRDVLISCNGRDDYDKKIDDIDFLICNAFAKTKRPCRIEIVLVQ